MEAFDTKRVPVRYHHLKAVDRSPRHAFQALRGDSSHSKEKELGSAVHAVLFNTETVVAAPMRRDDRSKAWLAFQAENEGSLIVTKSDYESTMYMVDSIRSNPRAAELLTAGGVMYEHTEVFDIDGRACRATRDVWAPGRFFVDLKSTKDASPRKFPDLMRDYDYEGQLDWYSRSDTATPYIIAVEKESNIVQVYEVELTDEARSRNNERLEKLLACEAKGAWQAYSADEVLVIKQSPMWPRKAA